MRARGRDVSGAADHFGPFGQENTMRASLRRTLSYGFLLLPLSLPGGAPAIHNGRGQRASGQMRRYFIAADEVSWDYVPGGRDEIAGMPYADTAFFSKGKPRPVSTVYKKVLYREYTDSTFRTLKPRPPSWEHLGFLGPLIRAVVGDTIRVVFRNNGHRPYSMHPHGVFYEKSSEGVPYNDGTTGSDKADRGENAR